MEEMVNIGELLGQYMAAEQSEPMSSEKFEEEKVKVLNSRVGRLKYIDCPKCLNRGDIAVLEDGKIVIRECSCMSKRRAMKRMLESGLEDVISRYTFASYQADELWQKTALEKCKEYAENPEGWLVVTGSPGTGKTHLCTAVCAGLIKKGYDVRYLQWRTDATVLKAYAGTTEYSDKVEPYKSVKVLYIDDFLKSRTVTEGDINLAFDIINARYNNKNLLTIISSEKTLDDIMQIDEAMGSRIYERRSVYIKTIGRQNWRMMGAFGDEKND